MKLRGIRMQKEAYDWYESQKENLGELFPQELDEYYKKPQLIPTAYSPRKGKYRQLQLKKFPYVIIYKIVKKQVVVCCNSYQPQPKDRITNG